MFDFLIFRSRYFWPSSLSQEELPDFKLPESIPLISEIVPVENLDALNPNLDSNFAASVARRAGRTCGTMQLKNIKD